MANNVYQSEYTGQQMDSKFSAVAALQEAVSALETAVAAKYTKPNGGIPSTDLDSDVQAALALALTAVQSLADYYTKAQVDAIAAAIASAVNSTSGVTVTTLPSASADTLGKIYYVGPDGNGEYARKVTSYDGTTYSWLDLGTTAIDLTQYATKAELSQLDQKVGDTEEVVISEITIPAPTWESGIIFATGQYLGTPSNSSANSRTNDFISLGTFLPNRKLTYTRGVATSASPSSGLVFYSSANTAAAISGQVQVANGAEPGIVIETIDVPDNATHFRTTLPNGFTSQFSAVVKVMEENYTSGIGKDVELLKRGGVDDKSLTIEKMAFTHSKNLLNLDDPDYAPGKYINTNTGSLANSNGGSLSTSPYMPVEAGKRYVWSNLNEDSSSVNYIHTVLFFDEERVAISSSFANYKTTPITAPEGACFVRITWYSSSTNPMLEEGVIRTVYEPYHLVLNDNVLPKTVSKVFKVSSFKDSGSLDADEYLTLQQIHVRCNTELSAVIEGTIFKINIGTGYSSTGTANRDYGASWLEITPTQAKLYFAYNNDPVLSNTYTHGLTMTDKTFVSVKTALTSNGLAVTLRMSNDLGDVVSFPISSWGMGMPFVENKGESIINVSLSFLPGNLGKKLWVFGDSYASFLSELRWPYYALQDGNYHWLLVEQPGMSPAKGVQELNDLLSLGPRPSALIWMLGMNGNTSESQVDGEYVINSYQRANIDAVYAICTMYGIELILTCVPTVPERQKTGFDAYVRSLGCRYIDIAAAVGADSTGAWNTGLLSSDDVHPTALGSKVIYSQILVDAPEITISE